MIDEDGKDVPVKEHTYYVPAHRKVYGDRKDDMEVVARLVAIYFRDMSNVVGRYDSVSEVVRTDGSVLYRSCHGCNGRGSAHTITEFVKL